MSYGSSSPPSASRRPTDAEERDVDFFQNPGQSRPPAATANGSGGGGKPPAPRGAVSPPSTGTVSPGVGGGSGSLDSFTIPTPSTPDSPLARSPSLVHGQVGSVVLHFHVGSAHFGPEKVKPLTYFTLETTVTQLPMQPKGAADESHDWAPTTAPICGDRRYSEFVEMRRCLCYAFPSLVIPPLPAKSHLEGMKTFWADQDALMEQQRTLEHFMREVAGLPAVLAFPVFHKFSTLPRDNPEFTTLTETLRTRNNELDAQRGLSSGGIGEATKLVRSVYTTVSGWFSGHTNGGQSGSGQRIPGDFDERMRDALSRSAEYQHWAKVVEHWTEVKRGVEGLLAPANTAVQFNQQMYEDQRDCAVAFENLSEILSESELLRKCSISVLQGAFVNKTISANHTAETARDLHNFCGALQHEACWIESALDAAKAQQYVIKTRLQQQILDGTSVARSATSPTRQPLPAIVQPVLNERERLAQCDAIQAALAAEMERFRYGHQHRIRHIIVAKVRRAVHYVDADLSFFESFNFKKETETPQWLLDCDMPPGSGGPAATEEERHSEVWINSATSEQRLGEREEALKFFALRNARR